VSAASGASEDTRRSKKLVEHREMGPSYDPDVAITTVARVPEEE